MKNSFKAIVGISLLSCTLLQSTGLESYLKEYELKEYQTLVKQGVDIKELELSAQNSSQQETSSSDKSITSFERRPTLARDEREACERDGDGDGHADGIYLNNNIIATCVSKDGTFGNGSLPIGMTFGGRDFLRPGSPYEYFSVRFDGTTYHNNNSNGGDIASGQDTIPTKISKLERFTGQNGGAMVESFIKIGDECPHAKGLKITQKYTLDPNAKEIILRVEMLNIGWLPINDLYYARGLDPDQDVPPFSTFNKKGGTFGGLTISPTHLVQAVGVNNKLAVALYSVDKEQHDTCIRPSWGMEPTNVIPCTSASPITADATINIGFKLGSLSPGQKKVFSFKYLFENKRKPRCYYPHEAIVSDEVVSTARVSVSKSKVLGRAK